MSNNKPFLFVFFFFNDTATTEIYTLSLHDALPIFCHMPSWLRAGSQGRPARGCGVSDNRQPEIPHPRAGLDRKSTRLNSSHSQISYAVFCFKKKIKSTHKET